MLVLGRKAGQSLLINEKIRVQILEVGSKQVKIGIDAPRDISVFRQELVDKETNNPPPSKE